MEKRTKKYAGGLAGAILLVIGILFVVQNAMAYPPEPPKPSQEMPYPIPAYISDVTVWLNATDPGQGASGVNFTLYGILKANTHGGWDVFQNWTAYTGEPFIVSKDIPGFYQIVAYSQDNAGNIEEERHNFFEIKGDNTDPLTNIEFGGTLWTP